MRKRNAAIRIEELLQSRFLSPAKRRELERELAEVESGQAKSKEKWWQVTFFNKRHRKTLTLPFPIEAPSKAAAIAEAKGRQSGDPKDNVNFIAKQVTMRNPKHRGQGSGVRGQKTTCTRCGGAHHVDYCNVRSQKSEVRSQKKENLFGFGKQAKKKRVAKARVRKAKRTYKADVLEAKARKLRAMNPTFLVTWIVKATRESADHLIEAKNGREALRKVRDKLRAGTYSNLRVQNPKRVSKSNPLRRGKTRAIVSANIRQLIAEGKSQPQAIAIALRTAGLSRKQNGAFVDAILQGAGFSVGAGVVAGAGLAALSSAAGKKIRRALSNPESFESLQRKRSAVAQELINLNYALQSPYTDHKAVRADIAKLEIKFADLGRRAIAAWNASGRKGNPDLLDIFAKGSAGLLNAIQIGRHLLSNKPRRRKKARRTPQQRVGNGRGQGSGVRGQKTANPNSAQLRKLYKDFHGEGNTGQVLNMIALEGSPDDAAQLGPLRAIKLTNGRIQTFPVKTGRVVKYRNSIGWANVTNPFAVLGGAQHGRTLRRAYIGQARPIDVPARLQNGKEINHGEIAEVEYYARKEHLYGAGSPWFLFYHRLGEEGGARPELIMRNGVFGLRGGDYKIQKEGIRD